MIADVLGEIPTKHIQNTTLQRYRYTKLLSISSVRWLSDPSWWRHVKWMSSYSDNRPASNSSSHGNSGGLWEGRDLQGQDDV
jgi:hypothetical protein